MAQSAKEKAQAKQIAELTAANEALKANEGGYRLQVSAKGGVSMYGLRRFPVTFYDAEWEVIDSQMVRIRAFRAEHATELTPKPVKVVKAAAA